MTASWERIWDGRRLDPSIGSTLARLMAADGLDTAFGTTDEAAWQDFADRETRRLGLRAGDEVFEVGCGAGALLYALQRHGLACGGIDRSAALVEAARTHLPDGRFAVAEATDLEPAPQVDAVLSFGVFLYFPSEEYAAEVVRRMARKARRAVAILDVPDAAVAEEAEAERAAASGGTAAYRARYAGLHHRYYHREWIADRLRDTGLTGVEVTDQDLARYPNGRFRFNARAFVAT